MDVFDPDFDIQIDLLLCLMIHYAVKTEYTIF